jgi:cytochrome c-type biogenesis protein CcmF
MPVLIGVLMAIAVFFSGLLSFVTSPFERLAVIPADGGDLNPLLQNPYMVSHPVLLYLGYVALSVPFAFAIAALVTGRLDTAWIRSVRRWTILAWLFLGIGIMLGSRWAYEELGWGGYWAWDPVENAVLMPWLVATAFLHSVMVQERRGMLKVWNVVLVIVTFALAIFGTFLTRSGILSSIHAFGESTLGPFFLAFIVVLLAGSLALVVWRLPSLRSQNSLESFLSREAIFLFNNMLLLGLAFTVFWGTIFPILTEAVRGTTIVVGQGLFNQVALPLGLALLVLTGAGPLIPWRRSSPAQLRRRFVTPLAAAALAAVALLVGTDVWSSWPAATTFTVAAFVVGCIVGEFWRAMRVRHALGGISRPAALLRAVAANRRRYGAIWSTSGWWCSSSAWPARRPSRARATSRCAQASVHNWPASRSSTRGLRRRSATTTRPQWRCGSACTGMERAWPR